MKKVRMGKITTQRHNLRIVPKFRTKIHIPDEFRKFLWDYPEGTAPLEMVILRILLYGKYEDIKVIYNKHPKETYYTTNAYPQIHRGVKFWINRWESGKEKTN